MKNIAIMIPSLNNGGAERIAGLLSKELSKKYHVYLFLMNVHNIVYEYEGEIINIGENYPFYEYSILCNKHKYHIDISISFLEPMNFANIRTKGKDKVIISERCVQSLIEPPFISQQDKIRKYYNYADGIFACSEGVKFDLIHNYAVKEELITTIYNFVDKKLIREKAKESITQELNEFLNGSEYFINIGRLEEQKNQKRLVCQFAVYHLKYNTNVKLVILGSGPLDIELKKYISDLRLNDYITIIPYTKNPFAYLKNAKAIILSSHYEGLPNVILEAMTLGCPIISTDCLAGPRELLSGELNYTIPLNKIEITSRGILVCDDVTENNGNTQYMAEAMGMLNDNILVEHLVQNELIFMNNYDNEVLMNQWIDTIENTKDNTSGFLNEFMELDNAEHIIIYGVGLVGKTCYLRMRKKYKIDCFAVTKKDDNIDDYLGVPIKDIVELIEYVHNSVVIVGVCDEYQDDVIRNLQRLGFSRFLYPNIEPLNYEYYLNDEFDLKSELENWYNLNVGKSIDLDNPKTFNEKIQWLKIYDNIPIKSKLADKYRVRNFVKKKIGEKYLVPLLGVWDSFEQVDFSRLPEKFVLKCNHASGTNLLVNDKSKLNYSDTKEKFDQWMKINYAYCFGFEMQYADINHKIIAEEMLESDDGEDLKDYKLFVFNGKVRLIQVDIDRHHQHRRNLYTPEWKYLPYSILYPTAPDVIISCPKSLDELILLAEILGKEFIHVRVDFYLCGDKIYFGEMTFAHGSGTENFEPESFGMEMGSWMKLPMEV